MTPSEPLARADGAAREGNIDCQDSQAIFDAHRALFGAATVRDRPLHALPSCVRAAKGVGEAMHADRVHSPGTL